MVMEMVKIRYKRHRQGSKLQLAAMGDYESSGANRNNDTGANWRVAYCPVNHGSRSVSVRVS